jgi:hypothetical protein
MQQERDILHLSIQVSNYAGEKKMPLKKSRVHWAAIAIFASMLLVSVVCAALSNNLSITFTGTISNDVIASSGSAADIQAAINIASSRGGGTVRVPAGTFDWYNGQVTVPGGVNVIGAGVGNTILHQTKSAPFNTMFVLNGENGKSASVAGLEFQGLVTNLAGEDGGGEAITVRNMKDYRISYCKMIDMPNSAISVSSDGAHICRGVIDHNFIDNPYKDVIGGQWAYGIIVVSTDYWDWDGDITHFLGQYESIPTEFPTAIIEDNEFYRCRHSVASNQLGWYVFRHNYAFQTNYNSIIDVHGAGTNAAGGRGLECYDNVLEGGDYGVALRGGSGVVYNNIIKNTAVGIQVAKDIDGTPLRPMNDLWIWGNTFQNVPNTFNNMDNYYHENVNYFLRPPSQAQDGFTYTPYQYPHHLVSG